MAVYIEIGGRSGRCPYNKSLTNWGLYSGRLIFGNSQTRRTCFGSFL